jgi:cytochrome c peroxidase
MMLVGMRFGGFVVPGLALGMALAGFAGCGGDDTDGFSSVEWQRINSIKPLSTEMPSNIADDRQSEDALARFGQKLFFEVDVGEAITVAGPSGAVGDVGKVGCVTCHGSKYFVDARPFPQSHGRSWLAHNTPTMVNLGWNEWTLWVGRFDSLSEHGAAALGGSTTPLAQAHYLYKKYKDQYNTLFASTPLDPALDPTAADAARFPVTGGAKSSPAAADGPFEKMTKEDQWMVNTMRGNMGKVFDAYPRKLITKNSAFEKYISGADRTEASFSLKAKNGLKLFIGKASCIDCHNGPLLSDGQFHNVGVPALIALPTGSTTAAAVDKGRGGALPAIFNNPLFLIRTNAMLPMLDQVPVYSGAGQFSMNPQVGMDRLVAGDQAACITRSADANAATCALLFRAPNPTAATPDPGDPRYQVCLDANAGQQACTAYDPAFDGTFRTPQLINIAETGPYFHTGEVMSLRDVVQHYNNGGGAPGSFPGTKSQKLRPLLLTDTEMDDLVEFLKSLTGTFTDPSWACNPLIPPPAAGAPAPTGIPGCPVASQ